MRLLRFKRPTGSTVKIFQKLFFPFSLIVFFAQFTLLFFWFEPSTRTSADSVAISCSDNGRIVITSNTWPSANLYWRAADILNINLGFGNFSFASAKIIDICWDLLVGRGGQVLLCIIVYPVVRRSLLDDLERRPIRVGTYTSLAFDRISFAALKSLLVDIYHNGRRTLSDRKDEMPKAGPSRWNWRYIWFCLVVAYVLLFPTLVAAMTGYQALFEPYVKLPNTISPVQISELKVPSLVIRDGKRIGLHDNYPVFKNDHRYNALLDYAHLLQNLWIILHTDIEASQSCYMADPLSPDTSHTADKPKADSNCPLTYADIAEYPAHFKLGYITFGDTSWLIPGRPLDILSQNTTLIGSRFPRVQFVSVENTALDLNELQKSGVCQQSQRYIWGFSSLLLFVFCIFTLLFAMMVSALHYDSFWASLEDETRYEFNVYRDAADLIYALEDKDFGSSLRRMSADLLKRRLDSAKNTITIQGSELPSMMKKD